MNLKIRIATLSILSLVLVGCTTATSPKLYLDSKKPLEIVKPNYFEPLKENKILKTKFKINYPVKEKELDPNNYVNSRGSNINLNKYPTVVIALPVAMEKNIFQEGVKSLDTTKPFKTEGYISESEAIVEKELIRFGFNVIDRSKFEAKLRALRSNTSDKVGSRIYEATISQLEKKKESRKITESEYLKELAELDKNQQRRNRGDNELIDMVELVRAAQSKGIQADYVLQLNAIEEYNGYPIDVYLKGKPEIENYLLKNPGLDYGSNGIPEKFETAVFRVVFAAKLFNVSSGQVLWSGSHEMNSLNVEEQKIIFDIVKEDIGTKQINQDINLYNNEIRYKYEKALNSYSELSNLYKVASMPRKYKSKDEQRIKERNLINAIESLEANLNKYNKDVESFNLIPRDYKNEIKYRYKVSNLLQIPDLNPENLNGDKQKERELSKHRQKLLSETVKSLLESIKVKM